MNQVVGDRCKVCTSMCPMNGDTLIRWKYSRSMQMALTLWNIFILYQKRKTSLGI